MVVANYELFRDTSFSLRIGSDIDRTLSANITNTPRAGEGAILMWKHWRIGSGPVSYRVSVNGTEVSTPTISGDTAAREFTSLHEVISTSTIQSGENEVEFRVTDGTGTVRIGDVVILYLQNEAVETTVADYENFSDVSFPLRLGGDIDRTLSANIANTPRSGEGAILMWKHWRTGSGPVSYRVRVNGTEVSTPTISGNTAARNFTSLHEVISTNSINAGENEVDFRVTEGTGTVRIGDVAIFYRRNLGTVVNESVAGYELFQDESFRLSIGADIDRTLSASITRSPDFGEGAILMWKHWRLGTGPVSYQVRVNGTEVSNPTISGDTADREFISLHEVIGTDDINSGENNIEFRVTDGTGTVRIGDVAILYRNPNALPQT